MPRFADGASNLFVQLFGAQRDTSVSCTACYSAPIGAPVMSRPYLRSNP